MIEKIKVYIEHIKNTCPKLTDKELEQFIEGLNVIQLHKNDFYIKNGQTQKYGGFLIKGLMRAFHTNNLGNEKNIYFIPENDYCFHYVSFMEQKPCPLSFQCIEDSIIITFTLDHLQKAFDNVVMFERYGRLIVENKLKTQQQRLESFLFQDAEQRYIEFINQYPQLFNRISISQLCSYLGVERQTLTRIRNKIARQKRV